MRLVSPLLKHAIYPALHHSGWLNRMTPPAGFAVVNYHGVVPADHLCSEASSQDAFLDANLTHPKAFRQQIKFLKDRYHVIHPEDFRVWIEQGKPLPARAVLLTCDDGLLNTLTDMLPMLQSENVSCLFFVTSASCRENAGTLWYEELYRLMRSQPVTEHDLQLPVEKATKEEATKFDAADNFQARWWSTVQRASRLDAGRRADWLAQLRDRYGPTQDLRSEKRGRLLNVAELRHLAAAGMSIGAHTRSHPILSLCSEEEARREISESKLELERALGRSVWAFAYPFGNPSTMGAREVRLAHEAGFSCAFLNVEHWDAARQKAEHPDAQAPARFALPRIHVTSNTTLPEFAAHLSGLHIRLQRAVGN
jgi:peptidoglycan/xylan/chitin deacetylase (PgdA/CDA1 family)